MPAANTFNRLHGKSGVKKLQFCCQFLQDKCSKMYFALANIVHLSWDKSTRTFAGDLNFELQFKFPALAQRPGYNKQTRAARAQHVFHLFLPSQLPSRSVSCPSDYVDARCCNLVHRQLQLQRRLPVNLLPRPQVGIGRSQSPCADQMVTTCLCPEFWLLL